MRTAYELLIEANEHLKKQNSERQSQWIGSPFEWLIYLPSRSRGAVGEKLVEAWLTKQGFILFPSKCSDFDRWCTIDNCPRSLRLEIKFSTLWEKREYVFQQIRNQTYDVLFCLGVSPQFAHAWAIPKEEAWENATPQHTGSKGLDTRWLHVCPDSPPEWLDHYGGNLEAAVKCLREMFGR